MWKRAKRSAVAAAIRAGILAIQINVPAAHAARSVTIPWVGSNSVALSFYTPFLGVGIVGVPIDHRETNVVIIVKDLGNLYTRASYQFSSSHQGIISAGNFCHQSGVLGIPPTADLLVVLVAQLGTTFPFTNGPCNDPAIAGTMTFAFT